jgi:hypothetical protein
VEELPHPASSAAAVAAVRASDKTFFDFIPFLPCDVYIALSGFWIRVLGRSRIHCPGCLDKEFRFLKYLFSKPIKILDCLCTICK